MNVNRYLSITTLLSGILLCIMVLFGVSANVSQQTFELLQPLPEYTSGLLHAAIPLRIILGLDNVFIALYSASIVLVVMALRTKDNLPILIVVLIAGLAGGVLDYIENHHILTMLTAVELGIPLEITDIKQQMVASMLKWHLAYFAFFLVAYVIVPNNSLEKLFRFSLFAIQLPIGVCFYISPVFQSELIQEVLFNLRYTNLVIGFGCFAYIFYRRSMDYTEANSMSGKLSATSL